MNRIGIIMDNSVEFIECLLEVWNQGKCAVLLDKKIPVDSLVEMMQLCHVKECFVDSPQLCDQLNRLFVTTLIEEKKNDFIEVPNKIYDMFIEKYDETEAVILFSSGTTGKRKGIILSHFAIQTNADAIIEYMNIGMHDKLLILKSLVHSSALVGELLVSLKCRCTLFIAKRIWNFAHILSQMNEKGINYLCINPAILSLMNQQEYVCKNYFSGLEKIYISGSVINKQVLKSFKQKVPSVSLFNVYGLTEMGPRVMAQREETPLTSVGKPIVGVSVKIVNDEGKEVEEYEKGIIHVKSRSEYLGYVNGEERKRCCTDYFNTGDIGWRDNNNNYFVVGRSDDMIITAAYNVYPNEVEEIIYSVDRIKDCLVFGVEDKVYGEIIICYYTADVECKKELIEFCKSKLSLYEIPKEFIHVKEIPKNINGKKDRNLAKEIYYAKKIEVESINR